MFCQVISLNLWGLFNARCEMSAWGNQGVQCMAGKESQCKLEMQVICLDDKAGGGKGRILRGSS